MKLNVFRGVGNQHFDLARILWAASCVAGIGYAGANLVLNHAFSPVEFGTGMGLLLFGGAAGTAAKDLGVAKAATTAPAGGE